MPRERLMRACVTRDGLREYQHELSGLLQLLTYLLLPLRLDYSRAPDPDEGIATLSTEDLEVNEGVTITGIDARSNIKSGDVVPVDVTVRNLGSYEEKAEITLTDTTQNILIGRKRVILIPRAQRVIRFEWPSKGFRMGDHILDAQAWRFDNE